MKKKTKKRKAKKKKENRLVDIISALAEAKFLDVQGHLPLSCRLNLNLRTYLTGSRAVSVYWSVSPGFFK